MDCKLILNKAIITYFYASFVCVVAWKSSGVEYQPRSEILFLFMAAERTDWNLFHLTELQWCLPVSQSYG